MKYDVEMHIENKACGGCKHWHEWSDERHIAYWQDNPYHTVPWTHDDLALGDCDRIAKSTRYQSDGETYSYSGESFEDDCYDEDLHCFEVRKK